MVQKLLLLSKGEITEITQILTKKGSKEEILGIVLGDKDEVFDLSLRVEHRGRDTVSRQNFWVVLKDRASCRISGLVKIGPGAQNSDAFMNVRAILLSDEARMETVPSLEISADMVKASHAAAVGSPDLEQINYLLSRGLSEKEAQHLLVRGFLSQVIAKIEDPASRKQAERFLSEY